MPERSNQDRPASSHRKNKIALSSPEKQANHYERLLEREGLTAEPAHPMGVPRKLLYAVEQIEDEAWQTTQSSPSQQELFEQLHVAGLLDKDESKAREQLTMALQARTITALSSVALDNLLLPAEEPFDQRGARRDIDVAMKTLLPKEQTVIKRRFGLHGDEPETLKAIGQELSVYPERVRLLETRAFARLRRSQPAARLRGYLDGPHTVPPITPPSQMPASRKQRTEPVAPAKEFAPGIELTTLAAGRELLPHLQFSSVLNLRSKDGHTAAIEHIRHQYPNHSYEYWSHKVRMSKEPFTDEDKTLSLGVSLLDARTEVKLFVAQFLNEETVKVLDYASRHMLRTDSGQHLRLEELVAGPNGHIVRAALMVAGEKTVLLRQAIADARSTSD